MIEWLKLSKNSPILLENINRKVVMLDTSACLSPVIGWYDPSQKGGGFYFRDGMKAVRVFCTHYIVLPEHPSRSGICEVNVDEFFESLMNMNLKDEE